MKTSWFNRIALALMFLFLIGPFFIVFQAAVSDEETLVFPPSRYGLRWLGHVFTVDAFRDSFTTSVSVGVVSTLVALLLGIPVAYSLSRHRPRYAEWINSMVTAPMIVPAIVVGLALLRYVILLLDLPVYAALIMGHSVLLVPYAVRVVSASLANLRGDIEDAAVTLGATRLQAFFRVVLPNIRGGVVSAMVLSFITSFNQVPVSLFLTKPGVSTLPIEMLSYMEFTFDPSIAALSTLLALFSMIVVFAAEKLLGISRYV